MKTALGLVFFCAAVTQAGEGSLRTWCLERAQMKNLLCAGTRSGLMEINVGFLVKNDGRMEAIVFRTKEPEFKYATTLNAEEMDCLLTLFRYAKLNQRPPGKPAYYDSGNWELTVNYEGKSNHVHWASHTIEEERGMSLLDDFLQQLTWQAEAARRLSVGAGDVWTDRGLQPYRLGNAVRSADVERAKQRVYAAENWGIAKELLEKLAPSLTGPEWCGLVSAYLKKATVAERRHALETIWNGEVRWPGIPPACEAMLAAVLESAASEDAIGKPPAP